MPFLTKKPLPRRTVLRGLGATMALPLLDAMSPAFSAKPNAAAAPTQRFQTFYVPNGMAMEYWTPQGEGRAFQLSPILEPLAPFREQLLVLSGLKANWNYIHAGASGSFLTGTSRGGRNEIEIIADDALEINERENLSSFLNNWINNLISEELHDLISLIRLKNKNQYLRALAFQLYEGNGVLKRSEVKDIINSISKDERKQFFKLGIKIGRYHIFLPKMLKPKAVKLRITLWKFFNNILKGHEIPKSGLNFLVDGERKFNAKFLLLCGFEKFRNFYVRVDILEKFFIKIIENTKQGKFQITSEMMNLLGSSKENFYQLLDLMNYKREDKKKDIFSYTGDKKIRKKTKFINKNNNPFKKLMSLNLK